MRKIAHAREAALLDGILPKEVAQAVAEIAAVLDSEYGADRDPDSDLGGYILVLESREELAILRDLHIDVDTVVPEYTDKIAVSSVSSGSAYTHTLLLLGSDFTVSLVMPLAITPERFVKDFAGEGWDK
jgi:hypothetical protein